ncbi:MAG: P-loop NTPase family protein [Leptospirales bacterium]
MGAQTVVLDLPANSRTLNRRSFYTNLTRTKGIVTAFTDDREGLTGAVSRENDKTLALDVEKEVREKERERKTRNLSDEQRFGETPEQTKARFGRGAIDPDGLRGEGEKKVQEEEKSREQKKEKQKEEKAASKEKRAEEKEKGQERAQEKDRSLEQTERQQEKAREEKKEAPRRERERGRDGLGY